MNSEIWRFSVCGGKRPGGHGSTKNYFSETHFHEIVDYIVYNDSQ
jgi:hypothetical protein